MWGKMKKEVYDYFLDLDGENLEKYKNAFVFDKEKFQELDIEDIILYKETPFYLKEWREEYSINSISSSNMYNSIGITTPPIYKIKKRAYAARDKYSELSQDVRSINNMLCRIANNIPTLIDIHKNTRLEGYKWQPFYDRDLRDEFLTIMTKDCFEQLMLIYLLGELRTDVDLHQENFFLCKKNGSVKFEQAIPIDLEMSMLIRHAGNNKTDFLNFLSMDYNSYGPTLGTDDSITYKRRLEDIRELIADGVLSEYQIDVLKKALNYDFPGEIKKTFEKYREQCRRHETCNSFARLWEYNRENLGKELNL